MSQQYYGNGEFEFITNPMYRALYKNMHNAITQTELWDWLKAYTPSVNQGFMFASEPELDRITKKMGEDPISDNHSGSSRGTMLRFMKRIADYGYENFKQEVLKNN
jgi:hypothetical protein